MPGPRPVLLLLGVLGTALGCGGPPSGPAPVVKSYLAALAAGDHETLFALDFREQVALASIRQSKPQALWDQLAADQKAEFISRSPREYAARPAVSRMMALSPDWKILEVRAAAPSTGSAPTETTVFVELRYQDPRTSPLWGSSPRSLQGTIQKAIAAVTLDTQSRLVKETELVTESVELWNPAPLRIASVWYRPSGQAGIHWIGGRPPHSATVTCGDRSATGTNGAGKNTYLTVTIGFHTGTCIVELADANGEKDRAAFDLLPRQRPGGSLGLLTANLTVDWFGREPWLSSGHSELLFEGLRNSTNLLRNDRASQEASK